MLNIYKFLAIVISFIAVTACSNSPPQITPSVPLISSNLVEKYPVMPDAVNQALNLNQTTMITNNAKSYILGKHYFSALGFVCRQMKEKTIKDQKEVLSVCYIDDKWQALPSTEWAQKQ